MPNLYIIAGCNGAGKTTASFTVLPEMLDCDEFINADEIARGISPLNPEKASIEAGRFMLTNIEKLITDKKDFAFETTLATKSYVNTVKLARQNGYQIVLVYFWLDSVSLAIERVKTRVHDGGHNIPEPVIIRRYYSGLSNLFNLYIPICDYWMIFDNSTAPSELVAEGYLNGEMEVRNPDSFEKIKNPKRYDKER
jgi:predicted ABC-type ATPase